MPKESETEVIERATTKLLRSEFLKLAGIVFVAGGFFYGTKLTIDSHGKELTAVKAQQTINTVAISDQKTQFAEINAKLDTIKEQQTQMMRAFRLTPVEFRATRNAQVLPEQDGD